MSHQDWGSVTFTKKKSGGGGGGKRSGGGGRAPGAPPRQANKTMFGHGMMGTTAGSGARRIMEEEETFKIKKVSREISKAIQQERMKKGMSQKELARLCNLKVSSIQSYENGTGKPNGKLVQTIEKVLGLEWGTISGKKRKAKKKK
eukprot:g2033.t1